METSQNTIESELHDDATSPPTATPLTGEGPPPVLQPEEDSSVDPHPMEHLNDESTGSGVTSLGDSIESSTNPMEDSMGAATVDPIESHPSVNDNEDEADHDIPATPATPTAAATTAAAPVKRYKCSHCSKSYVREFQLNTHVRKYHPEKPTKPQDPATPSTSPPSGKANNSWSQTDMEDALESLKTERMTLVKASQQYGIPASTLWQRATRLGIMIPKNGARTSSKDGVADAVQLLKTGQISVNKASKVFGIPPSTLYKIAKREGIQLSSPFNSATTSWTQENLQLAMDAIRTGQMSVHMASVEYKIPPGTLYGRCKREGLELSRNNPVQWSPRDLKNALEAVKTGQMSINQASEHYKISYSSLYKRVKPHFHNNNNNSNSSNNNLPKMGNELGETDVGVGGVIVPGAGMEVVSMHHPMDYEPHRALPHMTQQQQQSQHPNPPPVLTSHQIPYGNTVQAQQQQQQQHHYGQPVPLHQAATMHHYPAPGQVHQPLPVMRHHQQSQHHQHHHHHHQQQQSSILDESVHLQPNLHHHHQQQQLMHAGNNGQMQDDRIPGYGCHDVDKHGLTSSSGIGLNGLMGISMGFLDFAPELPAPVAVPVTEHYSLSSTASPYSSVITKDNSSGARGHPSNNNNGHYNNGGAGATAGNGGGGGGGGNASVHNGSVQTSAAAANNNNGYATLQNNYYHHHSVIHSPVQQHTYGQQQQQQQSHPSPMHHMNQQQEHTHQQQQIHQQQQHISYNHHQNHQQQIHHQGMHVQRHGMVPLNEDKLLQKDGLGSLVDPHAATAELHHDEKVIVTTINDL